MASIRLAAFTAAAFLALSMPAFAQADSSMSAAPAGAGKMSPPMSNNQTAMGDSSTPMTCQGMMDKAKPMMDSMADGSKKTTAMKQMDRANTAMAAGDEKTCMSHMKSAMHDSM